MRRLYLHIGSHKTGTTALQQSLHKNRVRLASCGAAFACQPNAAHLHNHLSPAEPGHVIPDGLMVTDPEALANLLAAADQDIVIASSENFSFFFQLAPVAALERALARQFDEVRILCYLRRQDRHAISHHQEGAKPGRPTEGALWGHAAAALPDPSPAHALYLDYDRRMGLWADAFGQDKLDLRVYDRARLKDGDIFADFLALVGLDIPGVAPIGERNASLGAAQTKAGHLMNALNLRPDAAQRILECLPSTGRLLPSRDQARAFLEPYRDSNRRLNARLALSPLPDLFDDDFDDFPETPNSDWTVSGTTEALQAVLADLTDLTPTLAALSPDDLRLAVQALQALAPESALRLLTAANALRPNDPFMV